MTTPDYYLADSLPEVVNLFRYAAAYSYQSQRLGRIDLRQYCPPVTVFNLPSRNIARLYGNSAEPEYSILPDTLDCSFTHPPSKIAIFNQPNEVGISSGILITSRSKFNRRDPHLLNGFKLRHVTAQDPSGQLRWLDVSPSSTLSPEVGESFGIQEVTQAFRVSATEKLNQCVHRVNLCEQHGLPLRDSLSNMDQREYFFVNTQAVRVAQAYADRVITQNQLNHYRDLINDMSRVAREYPFIKAEL